MKEEYEFLERSSHGRVPECYESKEHFSEVSGKAAAGHYQRLTQKILDNLPKSVVKKILNNEYAVDIITKTGEFHVAANFKYIYTIKLYEDITKKYIWSCKV